MDDHSDVLFGVAILWIVAWSADSAWRRRVRGRVHPPFSESDVRFVERFASGVSHKNLLTRLLGVHNALVVRVLTDGVIVEPASVLKWMMPPGWNDLEHYIRRQDILSVEPVSHSADGR